MRERAHDVSEHLDTSHEHTSVTIPDRMAVVGEKEQRLVLFRLALSLATPSGKP